MTDIATSKNGESPSRRHVRWAGVASREGILWVAALALAVGYALYRLDVLPLTTEVMVDGSWDTVPRAYLTIDHPFHIARSNTILEAWQQLDTVRWVEDHQGGYPAEFFPFGVPGIAALLQLLSLGTLQIASAYTLTVVALYFVPGIAYLLIVKADHLSPGVGLVALAGHLTIASTWLQGGYTELFEWGLVTNAAGSLFALLALPLMTVAVQAGRFRFALLAASAISLSVVSNPRSLIAIVVLAAAIALRALLLSDQRRAAMLRIGGVGALSLALSAPVVFPLLRYSDLYYFLHFNEHASVWAFLKDWANAVTLPIALLTIAGCGLAFVNRAHRVSQVMSLSLILYAGLTAAATGVTLIQDLIPQLELPRLMPFQRLLMLYLAAYALVDLARRLFGRWARRGVAPGAALAVATVLVLLFATGVGPRPLGEQAFRPLPRVEGTAADELVNFQHAVEQADQLAPAHTAILVLGTNLSWHEQLWAPMWADRRFYYDDWLWYWHRLHDGPYDHRVGHAYPNPSQALSGEYLRTHGIGAVVVTTSPDAAGSGEARASATSSELLESSGAFGAWDVYTVTESTPFVTLGGRQPDDVDVSGDNERVVVSFTDAEVGDILVRENWFPRWEASINGQPAEVRRAANGYIEIPTTGGDIVVELRYSITVLDVLARVLSLVAGVVIVVGLIVGPTPIRRWARRLWSAGRRRVRR